MPELPEVQTVCQNLSRTIVKKFINNIKIGNKRLRFDYPRDFAKKIVNQEVISIKRRARYILIYLSQDLVLLIHLGMTGKLLFENHFYQGQKHDHFIINFSDKTKLIYNDQRRFGFVDLFEKSQIKIHKMLVNLGPEPFSDDFNADYLFQKLHKKEMNIKTTMMDNRIVVGVGNIYINEALFCSQINPQSRAKDLSLVKLQILVRNIKEILRQAIDYGGSSIRNYLNLKGDLGNYQSNFNIYGKEGQNCNICHSKIKRLVQNGRSTFFCPKCQN